MAQLEFVTTADGSKTIFNPEVGENYHSRHGALQESRHVFLNSGLRYFLDQREKKVLPTGFVRTPLEGDLEGAAVLEVGFGTGLNFLLTADYCVQHQLKLDYTGIEAYPLTHEMIGHTGYDDYVSPGTWTEFMGKYPQALTSQAGFGNNGSLHIDTRKLLDFKSEKLFDVIYFDAFAAIHQPEMWDEQAIGHTIKFLKPGGVFVTYAITGNLKRMLKALGLKVEKAPGAPGKREMLRATL